jgi:hypothetical protein
MTATITAHEIHQVAFGLRPGRGLGPLASSFPDGDANAAGWITTLGYHNRLTRFGDQPLPRSALSHIRLDADHVALLYRWSPPGSAARNPSHALVAPAAVLTTARSIGMGGWAWPDEPAAPGSLTAVAVSDVLSLVDAGTAALRDAATAVPDAAATALLARLLDDPSAPMCVVGCADDQSLPLLWLVRAACGDYLRHRGHTRSWTFSTYETEASGAVEGTPEIVFAPGRLDEKGMLGRRITIDLDRPLEASRGAIALATLLLEHARAGRTPDLPTLPALPERDPAAAPTARLRTPGAEEPAEPMRIAASAPGACQPLHVLKPPTDARRVAVLVLAVAALSLVVGVIFGGASAPAPQAVPAPPPAASVTIRILVPDVALVPFVFEPSGPAADSLVLTPVAACTQDVYAVGTWSCTVVLRGYPVVIGTVALGAPVSLGHPIDPGAVTQLVFID